MAADIIKFENYAGGFVQTVTVYNPEVNLTLVNSGTNSLEVTIYIGTFTVFMSFKSRSLLDTFLSDLDTALGDGGTGIVTLSNAGPVATTTTTTAAPTTTTTTLPE